MEKKIAKCTVCDFQEEYEPDETGVNYFQAVGTCPICDAPTVDADGKLTREFLMIMQRSRTSTEDPTLFDGKRVNPVHTEQGTKYVDDEGNVWEPVDNTDINTKPELNGN